ncbi:MAG: hypothetical protein BroJett024_34130 [Alphaproteobacteria bacterium]|nr:MAG: hypothetical protein BroJett024_34130 [Alphaproteobacteria bacterium]
MSITCRPEGRVTACPDGAEADGGAGGGGAMAAASGAGASAVSLVEEQPASANAASAQLAAITARRNRANRTTADFGAADFRTADIEHSGRSLTVVTGLRRDGKRGPAAFRVAPAAILHLPPSSAAILMVRSAAPLAARLEG